VAVRLGDRPAHRREYKRASVPGTLHPPVAAAMVRLAAITRGDVVLDPCCGAGTLLIEAHGTGARLLGADADPAALRAATANAGPLAAHWLHADADALPLHESTVDRVLVNPPWDRQVPATGALVADPSRLWSEARRVLRPGGRLVALLREGLPIGDWTMASTFPVRISGATAMIVVARARDL
jgi:tRNA (guanine6-N2)-methyltransferase